MEYLQTDKYGNRLFYFSIVIYEQYSLIIVEVKSRPFIKTFFTTPLQLSTNFITSQCKVQHLHSCLCPSVKPQQKFRILLMRNIQSFLWCSISGLWSGERLKHISTILNSQFNCYCVCIFGYLFHHHQMFCCLPNFLDLKSSKYEWLLSMQR